MKSLLSADFGFDVELSPNPTGDFIANSTELSKLFFVSTIQGGWIVEAPMQVPPRAWKEGAPLLGIVADSYDISDGLPEQGAYALGLLPRDINSDFLHCGDGKRVQTFRFDPSTRRFNLVVPCAQHAFRHLAARGIPSAKK